jgi:tetratricopeptide (TPR) repeat protein
MVLLLPYPLIAQDKNLQKELETKAKKVVQEGVSFQKQGRLLDARAKYTEAQGIIPTKAATSALHSVNSAIQKKVASLLKGAKAHYDAMKFQEAVATLNEAVELQPGNASVNYNLALCSAKLGEKADAIDYLKQAIAAVSNQKERESLQELKVALTTGETITTLQDAEKAKVREFNQLALKLDAGTLNEDLDSPTEGEVKGKSAPGAPATKSKAMLCQRLGELSFSLPQSSAVLFNLARCAEQEGKTEDAVQLFNQYLQTSPNAVDSPDVQLEIEDLKKLTAINDSKADGLRSLYATASRYLDARKYDRALDAYHRAETLVPGFPQTKWRLALIYEMMGDTVRAREYFAAYRALEPGFDEKTQADIHLDDLESKAKSYREKVEDARKQLTSLLHRAIGLDTSVNPPVYRDEVVDPLDMPGQTNGMVAFDYVRSQLEQISKTLGAAYSIFPLAPAVNQMLGFVFLQGDGTVVQRHFDAVASQKQPVSFYASLIENKDSKASRFVKIELDRDGLRAIDVAIPDAKSNGRVLPIKPAGNDYLGNFVGSAKDGGGFSGLEAKSPDVKDVETKGNAVVVTLPDKKLAIFPTRFTGDPPPDTGITARKFANTYTRLFRDYLGIGDAKLGKEGMTGGEKLILGMMAGWSPALAMAETFREVRFMRINNALNASTSALQQNLLQQRQMVREHQFKLIPSEPAPPAYREDLR